MDEGSPENDKQHHYIFTAKGIQTYKPKGVEPVVNKYVSSSAPSVEETDESPTVHVSALDGESENEQEKFCR